MACPTALNNLPKIVKGTSRPKGFERGETSSRTCGGRSFFVAQNGVCRAATAGLPPSRLISSLKTRYGPAEVGGDMVIFPTRDSFCRMGVRRRKREGNRATIASSEGRKQDDIVTDTGVGDGVKQEVFVKWFRKAWPYIQGHRSCTFVIVIPGEVVADAAKINGVLQDILLLHGLGIKLVIIPGTQVQIDELLLGRGFKPRYEGAYRITDAEALAASMEAAGRVRVDIEAKLSRGPSIPILRRHEDKNRWHEVAIASGNYLAAKRRGVVDGVDFGATGEVKRMDTGRMKERLDNDCIVVLSNLGYSSTGEVLNCNTYEVATACAIALRADKLLVLLDGPILDENGRQLRFMTLQEADRLIRQRASQSDAAADYVKAVAGSAYVQSLGIPTSRANGDSTNKAVADMNARSRNGEARGQKHDEENGNASVMICQEANGGGFAIGGEERLSRAHGYLSELTAAVYVCRVDTVRSGRQLIDAFYARRITGRSNLGGADKGIQEFVVQERVSINGVGRVQLLDSNVQGALLLELYTRDGIGTMVSSDSYEGTRPATYADIPSIMQLLRPLEESGILVNRPRKQLENEVKSYMVVERDGSIIACAALFPYLDEKCGELASFAVSPECQGNGLGNTLLGYIEKKAEALKLDRLFLLTTRTSDWFVQRGFSECTVDWIPKRRQERINLARGSKYYTKILRESVSFAYSAIKR